MTALRCLILAERRLAMLLLAAALALRALLPAGTMPVAGEGHTISVAICDGTGVAGRHTIPIKGTDTSANEHPCAFSVLAMALDTGHEIAPVAPAPQIPATAPPVVRVAAVLAPPAALLPPARAPPAIA